MIKLNLTPERKSLLAYCSYEPVFSVAHASACSVSTIARFGYSSHSQSHLLATLATEGLSITDTTIHQVLTYWKPSVGYDSVNTPSYRLLSHATLQAAHQKLA